MSEGGEVGGADLRPWTRMVSMHAGKGPSPPDTASPTVESVSNFHTSHCVPAERSMHWETPNVDSTLGIKSNPNPTSYPLNSGGPSASTLLM